VTSISSRSSDRAMPAPMAPIPRTVTRMTAIVPLVDIRCLTAPGCDGRVGGQALSARFLAGVHLVEADSHQDEGADGISWAEAVAGQEIRAGITWLGTAITSW
jgi:hypothetical protein